MENASKALLIAGAILICIVLISVGMLVLNSTTDVTDQVGDITTSQAAQSFNSNFTGYAGKQKGSSVKQLLSTIATNNQVQANGGNHVITVEFIVGSDNITTSTSADISALMAKLTNSAQYYVKLTEMNNGYVSKIKITT